MRDSLIISMTFIFFLLAWSFSDKRDKALKKSYKGHGDEKSKKLGILAGVFYILAIVSIVWYFL